MAVTENLKFHFSLLALYVIFKDIAVSSGCFFKRQKLKRQEHLFTFHSIAALYNSFVVKPAPRE